MYLIKMQLEYGSEPMTILSTNCHLRHCFSQQSAVSVNGGQSLQVRPITSLVLDFFPVPHVSEHSDHGFQAVTLHLTENDNNIQVKSGFYQSYVVICEGIQSLVHGFILLLSILYIFKLFPSAKLTQVLKAPFYRLQRIHGKLMKVMVFVRIRVSGSLCFLDNHLKYYISVQKQVQLIIAIWEQQSVVYLKLRHVQRVYHSCGFISEMVYYMFVSYL